MKALPSCKHKRRFNQPWAVHP